MCSYVTNACCGSVVAIVHWTATPAPRSPCWFNKLVNQIDGFELRKQSLYLSDAIDVLERLEEVLKHASLQSSLRITDQVLGKYRLLMTTHLHFEV